MKELQAIVYTSSAVRLLQQLELEHLLERARIRNEEENVTGLLLYCDGNFMQYIEGPSGGLSRIFNIILRDPLHHNIIELVNEPVLSREFSAWSMAYSVAQAADMGKLLNENWIGLEQAGTQKGLGHGRLLLRNFWKNLAR